MLVVAGANGAGPRPRRPGAAVAQHAIPHDGVLASEISAALSGPDGSTLAPLCNATFASEATRQAREQVAFTIPISGGPVVAASDEIVRYSAPGAAEAFDELNTAVSSCPSSYSVAGGDTFTQTHTIAAPAGAATKTVAFAQYIAQQPGSPSRSGRSTSTSATATT